MSNLTTTVTPVEVTDPRSGETYRRCSRPIIDGPCIWTIFIEDYHGRMDLYQALTTVDGRLFDRKGPLSKADINRGRNVFRAIEKHGRESGQPCIGVQGRQNWYAIAANFLNKDATASNDYWQRRAKVATDTAQKLPRGKTEVRLADLSDAIDQSILADAAGLSEQISETYGAKSGAYASAIGMDRAQVRLRRQQKDANEAAEAAHEERMADAEKKDAA